MILRDRRATIQTGRKTCFNVKSAAKKFSIASVFLVFIIYNIYTSSTIEKALLKTLTLSDSDSHEVAVDDDQDDKTSTEEDDSNFKETYRQEDAVDIAFTLAPSPKPPAPEENDNSSSIITTTADLSRTTHSPTAPAPEFVDDMKTNNIQSGVFFNAFPNSSTLASFASFAELESNIYSEIPIPNNLNIAFAGDSLMRYQYLQLVYFLSHNGTWFPDDQHPHFTNEHQYKGWGSFYNETTTLMQPYEQCDCFRPDGKVWEENRQERLFENRYFYEPAHNNTIVYLQKMGNNTFKFSWDVKGIYEHGPRPLITKEENVKTIYQGQWVAAIQNHLCKLTPKPHVFIFNQGHWVNHLLRNATVQNDIVKALKKCNIMSIFKTKTKLISEHERQLEDWEVSLCNRTDYCQDVGWTGMVENKDYIDQYHFTPRIYRWKNLQTLSMLSSIARGQSSGKVGGVEIVSKMTPSIQKEKDQVNSSSSTDQIQIFYNLFIRHARDFDRVESYVKEQLAMVIPGVHKNNVFINAIGHNITTIANHSISQHYSSGNEGLTLHKIWEYCTSNPHHNTKVVYLHSKGSFHQKTENDQLRNFLTEGALSPECSNLPDQCNVCSSRMSPLPHPHTSGNMWIARCNYIAKLVNPIQTIQGYTQGRDVPCKGLGRYFFEHWVHSHPSVQPCDLYTGKEYVWEYPKVPSKGFEKKLESAPRFDYKDYVIKDLCLDETTNPKESLSERIKEYSNFYQTAPGQSWWGWNFYVEDMNFLSELEKDVHLLVKSHMDVDITESNSTALEVRKQQLDITIVIAYCDKPIDWIKEYIGQEYKVTEIFIYSKCKKEVGGLEDIKSFFNTSPQVIELPNIGRCDHTYAYHMRQHYQSILEATEEKLKDNIVMFLKDHSYHINFYRPIDQLYKMTHTLGFGCVMFFRPCYKPCFRQSCRRFEFTTMHNRTDLNNFTINNWAHFERDSQENFNNEKFPNLKSFEEGIGFVMPKAAQILPVCYGGSFAVKKGNILIQSEEVWSRVEKVLSRADNIIEGHYMERLWETALLGQSDEFAASVDEFTIPHIDHSDLNCGLNGMTAIPKGEKEVWIQSVDT